MQAQRMQLNTRRQRLLQARGKVGQHILASWLVVDQHNLAKLGTEHLLQLGILLLVAHHKGVIQSVDYLTIDDAF